LSAPQLVRSWVDHLPVRLEVRSPLALPDSSLAKLDAGERDAITLAAELQADQLIVDEREGRGEAERRRIPAIGTLGVLCEAATLKLVSNRVAVERLQGELLRCSRSSRKVVAVFTWTLAVTTADVNNHAL